jgi:hypothetical protein
LAWYAAQQRNRQKRSIMLSTMAGPRGVNAAWSKAVSPSSVWRSAWRGRKKNVSCSQSLNPLGASAGTTALENTKPRRQAQLAPDGGG